MPFRQAYQFTSAKLMIFIGYQIIIRHFFSSYPKTFKYCFLPSSFPLPPCPLPFLPPLPCPRSSLPPFPEVFFRAPAEGSLPPSSSLPRPPFLSSVLTVHNPQPPFCLHFSCPYVSLSICAFWLSHFYSFTPSSLLSCPPIPYAYSCVFSPFSLPSFSLLSLFSPFFSLLFPFVPLFLLTSHYPPRA